MLGRVNYAADNIRGMRYPIVIKNYTSIQTIGQILDLALYYLAISLAALLCQILKFFQFKKSKRKHSVFMLTNNTIKVLSQYAKLFTFGL